MLTLNHNMISGVIMANLAIGFWLFVALCAHASQNVFNSGFPAQNHHGIGGRLGFAYFVYTILWFAWWTYMLAKSLRKKYDLETVFQMKYITAAFILGNFLMTFIVIGAALQIGYLFPSELRNKPFFDAAKATIAALIVGMFTAAAFLYVAITQKDALLNSDEDNEPQAAPHLSSDATQEAFYQGAAVGYQADSSNSYGTNTAF